MPENLCKIDNVPAEDPHIFCYGCLASWLRIRKAVQDRLQLVYGDPTRETQPVIQNEMRRLNDLWKGNKDQFENEAKTWY